jgi:DNA-binding transcriptional ArsR family regulator
VNNQLELDRSFLALSHPVRRAVVERLTLGPATVGEVSWGLPVTKPAVTKHLKVLEEVGVVTRTVRGRRHVLQLHPGGLHSATQWFEVHRALWEKKFDAIEQRLETEETG